MVTNIVKLAIFVGKVDLNEIMLVSVYQEQCRLMYFTARNGRWDAQSLPASADIRTVDAAQSGEKRFVIGNITKSSRELPESMLRSDHLVNFMTSRAQEMLAVLGHWDFIMALLKSAPLKEFLLCCQENCPNFLLRAGDAPFHLQHENAIASGRSHEERSANSSM